MTALILRRANVSRISGHRQEAPMRNVDCFVIAPTVAYVLLVFALWVGLAH